MRMHYLLKKLIFGEATGKVPALGVLLLLGLFFLLGAVLPAAAEDVEGDEKGENILEKIDAQVTFMDTDFSAEYTITQERPGQGTKVTKAAVFRRDSEDTYLVLILEPESDKGKGYLKIGNNLWVYDPNARRFNVTSARDRFQSSNARNSDFTKSTLAEDYEIVDSQQQQLGAYETTVFELEAVTEEVTYPRMKIWVDTKDLVRKVEEYSLSEQLMRTTAMPSYRRLNEEHFIPENIVIVDELQGRKVDGEFRNERTIITVEKPSLRDVPDMVFTKTYLERISE